VLYLGQVEHGINQPGADARGEVPRRSAQHRPGNASCFL
jgi:hypothetical protein